MLNELSKILCTLPKITLYLRHASCVKDEFHLLKQTNKSKASGYLHLVWVFGERSMNVEQLKKKKKGVFTMLLRFTYIYILYFYILIFLLKVTFQLRLKNLRPYPSEVNILMKKVSSTAWLYLLYLKES